MRRLRLNPSASASRLADAEQARGIAQRGRIAQPFDFAIARAAIAHERAQAAARVAVSMRSTAANVEGHGVALRRRSAAQRVLERGCVLHAAMAREREASTRDVAVGCAAAAVAAGAFALSDGASAAGAASRLRFVVFMETQ